jgi:hypothetical protein
VGLEEASYGKIAAVIEDLATANTGSEQAPRLGTTDGP